MGDRRMLRVSSRQTGAAARSLTIGLFIALVLSACAAPPPQTLQPLGPAPEDAPLFTGRIICLDPGHGGTDTGAVGRAGLRESDANLQVSLALRDLLRQAGARVVMTRETDTTVSLPDRVKINLQSKSDVFLSLHHNSSGSAMFNRTEMYYHHKDYNGPSGDLAGDLLRHFEQLYDFPKSRTLVAYAYHVLRENEGTAVLGEPSYLSDPFMELRLKTPEGVQDEARAYYRALRDFFSRGTPKIRYEVPDENPSQIMAQLSDDRTAIDPGSVTAALNGKPAVFNYDPASGQALITALEELPGGTHTVVLRCANLNGSRSAAQALKFRVERRVERIALRQDVPASGPIRVEALITDSRGRAAADETRARLSTSAPVILAETHSTNGRAWFYVMPGSGANVTVTAGGVSAGTALASTSTHAGRSGILRDGKNRTPVAAANMASGGLALSTTDRNGWFALNQSVTQEVLIQSGGFDDLRLSPEAFNSMSEITLRPRLSGLLAGRKIYIDPEEGGESTGALSAYRVRAADVNLQVAQELQKLIEWAGGEGILAREDDRTLDSPTRARLSLDSKADVYLSILHGTRRGSEAADANVCRVHYRWDSARPWAERMAPVIADCLGVANGGANMLVTQALMHSNADYRSVAVEASYLTAPGLADRAGTPAFARREAVAILYGLAEGFAQEREASDPSWKADRLRLAGVVSSATSNAPVAGALVVLEGGPSLQTGADGLFDYKYLAGGAYELNVVAAGFKPARAAANVYEGAAAVSIRLEPR